jgi:hypothetical protein
VFDPDDMYISKLLGNFRGKISITAVADEDGYRLKVCDPFKHWAYEKRVVPEEKDTSSFFQRELFFGPFCSYNV